MAADEVLLHLESTRRWDEHLGEAAEPGGHAVDPLALHKGALDDLPGGGHGGPRGVAEADVRLLAGGDAPDIV